MVVKDYSPTQEPLTNEILLMLYVAEYLDFSQGRKNLDQRLKS